jgi:CPA1 family monovalent cation:H+ antiporter
MVLALSLPAAFPNRDLLVAATFGVVLLSILVQGLTMAPLLRHLGLAQSRSARTAYDRRRGELNALQVALAELDQMTHAGEGDLPGLEGLRAEYQARLTGVRTEFHELRDRHTDLHAEDLRRARRHLLMVEKAQTIEAAHQGLLSPEAREQLLADVDGRLLRLEDRGPD